MTVLSDKIARIETRLTQYYAAEDAILSGAQSYSIGNRTLTRASLDNIQRQIRALEGDLVKLNGGGYIRLQRGIPVDL
jgi:hypothetical protein